MAGVDVADDDDRDVVAGYPYWWSTAAAATPSAIAEQWVRTDSSKRDVTQPQKRA
jgi:hypothetical protein